MMDFTRLQQQMTHYLMTSPENRLSPQEALLPELAGMQLCEEPLLGVADANDPLFLEMQQEHIVGPQALLPQDLIPTAKSVISFFLPFSEEVRRSNRESASKPSAQWLHARIEGQLMLDQFGRQLYTLLQAEGAEAVYVARDARFQRFRPYSSNWSERHIAYICGLGTFGISRGVITAKGMAGRFGSVVTTAVLPVTVRPYSSPFEYCILCGKCQKNCPAKAIDITKGVVLGKDQQLCGPFVNATKRPPQGPHQRIRYGCGKCQVNVPCESGIPPRRKAVAVPTDAE